MALRKFLYMDQTEGFPTEQGSADEVGLGKLTVSGVSGIGIDAGNASVVNVPNPTNSTDAANKAYVDGIAQGLVIKAPVDLLEDTNNITLSDVGQVIDGSTVIDLMRVLLTAQTNPVQNGIWVAHTGAAWTRPTDFPTGGHFSHNFVLVGNGTTYGDTGWVETVGVPDIIDTNAQAWVLFSSAGIITAGAGLTKNINVISVKKGDGIEVVSNGAATNVDLASDAGLQFVGVSPNGKVGIKVYSTGGIQTDSNGVSLKLNGTTLETGASGVSVKGLPSQFEIATVAVSASVTAANLDTLTAGSSSNADALHYHSIAASPKAEKIEKDYAVSEAVVAGDPVYWSTTNDRIARADASSNTKSNVVGIARLGQSTVGDTAPVVSAGPCSTIIAGATAGTLYFLQPGGGIGTTMPGSGKRIVQAGFAMNGSDLFVRILDFGKKA
jgi:hypothetical protein